MSMACRFATDFFLLVRPDKIVFLFFLAGPRSVRSDRRANLRQGHCDADARMIVERPHTA
jgi:hypothetical protein